VILIDTAVWIDYLKAVESPHVHALRSIINGPRLRDVLVGDLVLCEVLRGVRDEVQAAEVERALSAFLVVSISDDGLAIVAARNYRQLRTIGITIRSTIDLLIGTFCIAHGHALLHRDRDFDVMERHLGLQVVRA
jgi:hypothetical protein